MIIPIFILLFFISTYSSAIIDTTPFYLDSSLQDIRWCGSSSSTVIILTKKGTLYRSQSKGIDFESIKNFPPPNPIFTELIQNPIDPNIFLIKTSDSKKNYITQDCGSTFELLSKSQSINEISFHPIEKNWILAAAWRNCDPSQDYSCFIYKELFISLDLGKTWKVIEDYVVQFGWACTNSTDNIVPKERILLSHDPRGEGSQNLIGWSESVHLSYSDDFFKSFKEIVHYGNRFILTNRYLYVAYVTNEGTQDVSLKISDSNSLKYDFSDAELPFRRLTEHSYTILDSSEDQIFLHINHYGPKAKFGNVYISDSMGKRFSLSIENNAREDEGNCEFDRVKGLEGIYITNVYDKEKVELTRGAESSGIPFETTFTKRQKDKSSQIFEELDNYKRTYITFDKGGVWSQLPPPLLDSKNKSIKCKDNSECKLHLNSIISKRFGMLYSASNSLGIVMGTGNIGKYLSNRADEINTYLSRDGGLTWFEVAKGSHIYEYGDHGGIIVMAEDQKATKEILYTWNEGITFEKLQINDEEIEIENIIIEPSNTGLHFLVYGEINDKGIIINLDFTNLHQRNCEGWDTVLKGDNSLDYELWSPKDEENGCLMGRKVTYARRKRTASCFNTQGFDRAINSIPCECTENDWECDIGYRRKGSKGQCLAINEKTINSIPDDCNGFYYISQGYRKVSGDQCYGGVQYERIKAVCPNNTQFTKVNLIILGILASIIVVILCLGSENRVKNWIEYKIRKAKGNESCKTTGFEEIGKLEEDQDLFDP